MRIAYWKSLGLFAKLSPFSLLLLQACERPVRIDRMPSDEDVAKAERCDAYEKRELECDDGGMCNWTSPFPARRSDYISDLQCNISEDKLVAHCEFSYQLENVSSEFKYSYVGNFMISSKSRRWCVLNRDE